MLKELSSARYGDNLVEAVTTPYTSEQRVQAAAELTSMLNMPVGHERGGDHARCLELRIKWISDSNATGGEQPGHVKAVLAYRTDPDRQGESGDLRTWPEWRDPRAKGLLHGLLCGLAAKVVQYSTPGMGGLPASVRGAVRFLRQRGYPSKKWLRPFGLELLRRGVPMKCLPKSLKGTLTAAERLQRQH